MSGSDEVFFLYYLYLLAFLLDVEQDLDLLLLQYPFDFRPHPLHLLILHLQSFHQLSVEIADSC